MENSKKDQDDLSKTILSGDIETINAAINAAFADTSSDVKGAVQAEDYNDSVESCLETLKNCQSALESGREALLGSALVEDNYQILRNAVYTDKDFFNKTLALYEKYGLDIKEFLPGNDHKFFKENLGFNNLEIIDNVLKLYQNAQLPIPELNEDLKAFYSEQVARQLNGQTSEEMRASFKTLIALGITKEDIKTNGGKFNFAASTIFDQEARMQHAKTSGPHVKMDWTTKTAAMDNVDGHQIG